MLERIKEFIGKYSSEECFFERIKLYFPEWSPEYKMIARAYAETIRDFRHKLRDGGTPYFEHPLAVAIILLEYLRCRDANIIVAAILHDNAEDLKYLGWTFEYIANSYREPVVEIVWWVTKPPLEDYNGDKEKRDRMYHQRFSKAPRSAVFVKLADRLHNLLTLMAHDKDRRMLKIQETRSFYFPLAEEHTVLIHELEEAVSEIEVMQ